ncbi:hypothetical protein FJ930_28240 [Mesorhizobium sp. B2-4-15]|uniref:hypothetical protein n=1 Tax=Mesorhizobium sp. B2-4-15 TaxID=2589934 RepID=UPI00115030F9|nr:hypothetical protein [Mesorhizobium sp. B2-4-15]TPK60642.1 hypothetical protein FJ930_28240 [Mesorhizobium sp. B2-4-15]
MQIRGHHTSQRFENASIADLAIRLNKKVIVLSPDMIDDYLEAVVRHRGPQIAFQIRNESSVDVPANARRNNHEPSGNSGQFDVLTDEAIDRQVIVNLRVPID